MDQGGWRQSRLRVPLMGLAIVALLAGLWAGWLRLGWQLLSLQPALSAAHGPLMVSGFLGTLIALERAVALQRRWTYLAPALSGLGGLLLVLGVRGPVGPLLFVLGSLGLVLVFVAIVHRHMAVYTLVMAAGAGAWLVGNLFWVTGRPVYQVVLWWAAFLILTVAGERLELGRLARLSLSSQAAFLGATGPLLVGLLLTIPAYPLGTQLFGTGLLALAAWLLRYDIARRTVRKAGLPRYAALCLLSGYAWLAAAGAIAIAYGGQPAGPIYDALLHAVFLGFIFSMIFGHAPIIFPAVLGVPVRFHPVLYLHLVLLHASLILRVGADLSSALLLRRWSGMFNGVALLLFLAATAYTAIAARRSERQKASGGSQVQSERLPAASGERPVNEARDRLHWGWYAALGSFILAGLTGSLWRFGMLSGLPGGLQFGDIRHAHSHLMYFGWVTPGLMALIATWLSRLTGRPVGRRFGIVIAFTLVSALLAYPLFLRFGYRSTQLGSAQLPLATIASGLNILAWYAFGSLYWRQTRGLPRTLPLKLWDAALLFLILASLGAWGRASLAALGASDPFWTGAMVRLFLDLFSEGWFMLALLGLAYASHGSSDGQGPSSRLARWGLWMVFLGLPVTFLLGLPVFLVPGWLRALAGAGGFLVALGLLVNVWHLWNTGSAAWRAAWKLPLALLALKALMQLGYSLPQVAAWGERMSLRLLYLHILLLGFVSLGLLVAAGEAWGGRLVAGLRWMAAAVLIVLASLLPFTGLWPAALSGGWMLPAAAWVSLLPVIVAAGLLISGIFGKQLDGLNLWAAGEGQKTKAC